MYNARAHVARRRPSGYPLNKDFSGVDWFDAWTLAMALDAGTVTPFVLHVFGSLNALRGSAALDLQDREDVEIVCPANWKI